MMMFSQNAFISATTSETMMAVKFFKMKMRARIRRLDIAIAKSKQCMHVYELSPMEEKYREIRQTKKWKVVSKN